MLTGRRFRARTHGSAGRLRRTDRVRICRAVWNVGLEQRREYRRRGAWINYREQAHELADAKAEHTWLADAPGHCLQQTLMDLDQACRQHGTFKVRWRSNRRSRPSFRFPEGNKMTVQQLNRSQARVKLPKLGWVRFRLSRCLDDAVDPLGYLDPRRQALVSCPSSSMTDTKPRPPTLCRAQRLGSTVVSR